MLLVVSLLSVITPTIACRFHFGLKCDELPVGCNYTDSCFFVTCRNVDIQAIRSLPPHLIQLNVTESKLPALDNSTFPVFTMLQFLNLSFNGIGALGSRTFAGMSKLQTLCLNNNDISVVKGDSFAGLVSLQNLDVSHNLINCVYNSTFGEINNLQYLFLHDNNISTIEIGAFKNLTQLRNLTLERNKLMNLNASYFTGLVSLEFLNMGRNSINEIGDNLFKEIRQLQILLLHYNRLSYISPSAFQYSIAIKNLTLHHNSFKQIPNDSLSVLTSLEFLSFNNNPIPTVPSNVFSKLTSLKELQLRSMEQLTLIEQGAFHGLKNLEILMLENSAGLSSFGIDILPSSDVPVLSTLLLRENGIATFDRAVFDNRTALSLASIDGNPIKCDCSAKWIREVMDERVVWASSWNSNKSSLACYTPAAMFGLNIRDLSTGDLTCDEPVVKKVYPDEKHATEGDTVVFAVSKALE